MSVTPLPPRTEALPVLTKLAPMSPSLAWQVGVSVPLAGWSNLRSSGQKPTVDEAEADPRMVAHLSPPDRPTRSDINEAHERITEAEHLCRASEPRLIAAWCRRLQTLPFAPANEAASQAAIAAICLACGELPAAVWTVATAAEALRTFKHWPAPAEVFEHQSLQAKPFWRARDGLRRVLAETEAPATPRDAPSQTVRDEVSAVVATFTAERTFNQPARSLPSTRPAPPPLEAKAMLAVWEKAAADKVPGAEIRVAMLRAAIAKTAPESTP